MRIFYILLLSIAVNFVHAQSDAALFYLDAKMQVTPKEKAVIVVKKVIYDSAYRVNLWRADNNQLLMTIDYKDSLLNMRNGSQIEYYDNGQVAQISEYKNEIMDGVFKRWNRQGLLTDSINYVAGCIISKLNNSYTKNRLTSSNFIDSLHQIFRRTLYDTTGNVENTLSFTGNKGLYKTYNSDGTILSEDSVFSRTIKNAEFAGGSMGWRNYLQRALRTDIPMSRKIPRGNYTVLVKFIIDKDGTVSDIKTINDHIGYGVEEEAIRVVKAAKWSPALHYGLPVKAYRVQPIIFSIN